MRVNGEVWTSTPDDAGSDRIYLGQLGEVSAVRYSSSFPGGPKALSCTLNVDPLVSHRALTPGRDVGVTVGAAEAWLGQLNAPTVNDDGTRAITADGDAATTQHFVALGLGTHNALDANDVLDAARVSGRHSRFGRPLADLPVPDGLYAFDGAFMTDEALTQNASAAGKRWRVDLDRIVRFYDLDGDGTRLLLRARHDIGRTLDGFVTRLDAVYVDAATGLRNVEHLDAPPADTGSTFYPAFYTPDGSALATGHHFTLYSDGTTVTAYAIFAYAAATTLTLDGLGIDLALAETAQFYTRWTAPASLAVGVSGVTGTYKDSGGGVLGVGAQEGKVHRGRGSLGPTGNIAPREAVIDLTTQGAFTRQEVNAQLAQYMAKTKTQPHYQGSWTASHGDLLNRGGVPVNLATVRAGCQVAVLVVDPTRNLSLAGDSVLVTIGEVEYDADTDTLALTPAESPELADRQPYIDPATGLAR